MLRVLGNEVMWTETHDGISLFRMTVKRENKGPFQTDLVGETLALIINGPKVRERRLTSNNAFRGSIT